MSSHSVAQSASSLPRRATAPSPITAERLASDSMPSEEAVRAAACPVRHSSRSQLPFAQADKAKVTSAQAPRGELLAPVRILLAPPARAIHITLQHARRLGTSAQVTGMLAKVIPPTPCLLEILQKRAEHIFFGDYEAEAAALEQRQVPPRTTFCSTPKPQLTS